MIGDMADTCSEIIRNRDRWGPDSRLWERIPMRERFRRWLCAPSKLILFDLTCNHCEHRELIDARELTVQVTDKADRAFLACACERCRRPIATQVSLAVGNCALNGGAKFVHLEESRVIREQDIRRFNRSMDAELQELLS